MAHTVKIVRTEMLNPSVKRFVTTRPEGYSYEPGQATMITLLRDGYRSEPRPFTFTSLPSEDELEFIVKLYFERDGVTDEMAKVGPGESFQIDEPKGAISYKGPGLFIAGGAGVTPFIPILRQLVEEGDISGQEVWFSNSEESDIFLENELREMLDDESLRMIVTDEDGETDYEADSIDLGYLEKHLDKGHEYIYVCGPPEMTKEVVESLEELGYDDGRIVYEEWSD